MEYDMFDDNITENENEVDETNDDLQYAQHQIF